MFNKPSHNKTIKTKKKKATQTNSIQTQQQIRSLQTSFKNKLRKQKLDMHKTHTKQHTHTFLTHMKIFNNTKFITYRKAK